MPATEKGERQNPPKAMLAFGETRKHDENREYNFIFFSKSEVRPDNAAKIIKRKTRGQVYDSGLQIYLLKAKPHGYNSSKQPVITPAPASPLNRIRENQLHIGLL